ERGAAMDRRDKIHGTTPIYGAFWGLQPGIVDGLAPLSRDAWALTCAGKVDRLRELMTTEPDLAKMRDEEDTILFYLPDDEPAAADTARLLVAQGADPSVGRKRDGATAALVARGRGLDAAADALSA